MLCVQYVATEDQGYNPGMENRLIARILRETAELLEIDGAIIGRYRSYQKAAELIDSLPQPVEPLVETPEKLLELPGIGQRMVEHLSEIVKTGDYSLRKKLLKKYPETILDLLSLQSLGPKKVLLLWKTFKAATVADVETLAKEGKLRDWFEQQMITPAGTRGTVFRGSGTTGGILNQAVEVLDSRHLIRRDSRAGAEWYELTHDRFIEPILASNARWRKNRGEADQIRPL